MLSLLLLLGGSRGRLVLDGSSGERDHVLRQDQAQEVVKEVVFDEEDRGTRRTRTRRDASNTDGRRSNTNNEGRVVALSSEETARMYEQPFSKSSSGAAAGVMMNFYRIIPHSQFIASSFIDDVLWQMKDSRRS